ncbi:hypothetical protein MMC30_000892 [Trapelia coarctata]|nr:hypothetical protein [Trapelia coarctata]
MDNATLHEPLPLSAPSPSLFSSPIFCLPLIYYALPALLAYISLCSLFRHRRLQDLENRYPPATYARLTPATAQRIILTFAQLEAPFIFETSLQFALFRTYGIPTISGLLEQTGLLGSSEHAAKRYVDTDVLITEFVAQKWGGERWAGAVGRMNAIHAAFGGGRGDMGNKKAGGGDGAGEKGKEKGKGKGMRIKAEDMLYTLSLFAWEPVRWTQRWEWREVSDLERCAMGVYWKGIGDAMGIDYSFLPGGQPTPSENGHGDGAKVESIRGWRDGLHWMDELANWAGQYEKENMLPADCNTVIADETVALLLVSAPPSLKPFGKKAVAVLMDPHLRTAMQYPTPPAYLTVILHTLLHMRRLILRYLCLPRPEFLRVTVLADKPDNMGRYIWGKYLGQPWYVKPGFWNRWGGKGLWRKVLGLPVPGDEGEKFMPAGYRIEELGPRVGKRDWETEKVWVREVGERGCPIGFGSRKRR